MPQFHPVMTIRATLGWAIALATMAIMVGVGVGGYWLISFPVGNKLAAEGYKSMVRGDYDTSIRTFTESLGKKLSGSQRALAHVNRGIAYTRKRQFDEAIRDFTD